MKRSTQVAAPLLAAAALAMTTGCRRPEMQRCIDENNHVVADSFCKDLPNQQQSSGPFYHPIYRYYYGGWGSGLGNTVGGGGYIPIAGHSYSTSTIRGGFGSSFSGEGGGHGGGAGE